MAHKFFWKVFKLTIGWFLLIIGFIGLFVPILQGFLLMLAGISILAAESLWARNLLAFLKRKVGSLFRKKSSNGLLL
jgi:uncharacterized protein YqgC (DUF456 family)